SFILTSSSLLNVERITPRHNSPITLFLQPVLTIAVIISQLSSSIPLFPNIYSFPTTIHLYVPLLVQPFQLHYTSSIPHQIYLQSPLLKSFLKVRSTKYMDHLKGGKVKAKSKTRSTKFPVGRIHRLLRKGKLC
ncbi:Histone H2A, partial [Armadillidium nasatum]